MSDIKNILVKVRAEAAAAAEREYEALLCTLPTLPTPDDPLGARPQYTEEQRRAYVESRVQKAVDRLGTFMVDAALGRVSYTWTI